jgi:hypothetical protein
MAMRCRANESLSDLLNMQALAGGRHHFIHEARRIEDFPFSILGFHSLSSSTITATVAP